MFVILVLNSVLAVRSLPNTLLQPCPIKCPVNPFSPQKMPEPWTVVVICYDLVDTVCRSHRELTCYPLPLAVLSSQVYPKLERQSMETLECIDSDPRWWKQSFLCSIEYSAIAYARQIPDNLVIIYIPTNPQNTLVCLIDIVSLILGWRRKLGKD
jgi:hypothetical protein